MCLRAVEGVVLDRSKFINVFKRLHRRGNQVAQSVLDSGICCANVPGLLLCGQLVFLKCSSVALIVLIVYGLTAQKST